MDDMSCDSRVLTSAEKLVLSATAVELDAVMPETTSDMLVELTIARDCVAVKVDIVVLIAPDSLPSAEVSEVDEAVIVELTAVTRTMMFDIPDVSEACGVCRA